jgi:GlpG protein
VVDVRGQWTVPRAKPVTILLVLVSCVVAFANGFGEQGDDTVTQALLMASEDANGMYHKVFRPGSDVLRGQIWRLITPIFLHFGPMHLIMNMLALHSLGTLIEMRRGSWRLALMVLAIALLSNLAQYAYKGPGFGGMSGVVFGLFGYAWMKSEFDPGAGMVISSTSVALMLGWLVLCMTGYLGPIANAAHFVGLIVGILLGYGPVVSRRFLGR